MKTSELVTKNVHIILFDGVCNLCSGWVSFVYKRDITGCIKFVSVQSETGQQLLMWCGLPIDRFETMVYIENGQAYFKSDAFLRIIKWLSLPWPYISIVGALVFKPVRDWGYDRIALNRYHLFGKRTTCMIPSGQLASRFL